VIYMRAGYIAVLGTLFLYACLLSWRKHRLTQAVARAEASRDAVRPAPTALSGETPSGETPSGQTPSGQTPWGQGGVARADATPPPDGPSVARLEVPSEARLQVPPVVGR
jgi:hypothetical protein